MLPTEGVPVFSHNDRSTHEHNPDPDELAVPELEFDQTVPPRPEEEIADALREDPDAEDDNSRPE